MSERIQLMEEIGVLMKQNTRLIKELETIKNKRELVIKIKKEGDEWVADTNLCGAPPIGRDKNWRIAVGDLIFRLNLYDSREYRELWHIPKWETENGENR